MAFESRPLLRALLVVQPTAFLPKMLRVSYCERFMCLRVMVLLASTASMGRPGNLVEMAGAVRIALRAQGKGVKAHVVNLASTAGVGLVGVTEVRRASP